MEPNENEFHNSEQQWNHRKKSRREKRRNKENSIEQEIVNTSLEEPKPPEESVAIAESSKNEPLEEEIKEEVPDTPLEEPRHGKVELPLEDTSCNTIEEKLEEKIEEPLREEGKASLNSHTETLNDLVKEVQIFSDDDEFFLPQKKGKGWIFFFVILLALIAGGLCYYFLVYEKKDTPVEEKKEEAPLDTNYSYEEKEDSIDFLKGQELVDSYLCKKTCSVYSLGRYQYHKDGVIALQDGEDIFLYDYIQKEKISDNYLSLKNLVEGDTTVSFLAEKEEGYGVISTKGEEIIPFEYEDMAYSFGGGDVSDYSYEKKIITASKDGKWGLISLEDGKEILPFEYEDIYYSGYDAIAVQKEGLWHLLDLEGKELLKDDYDMIIPLKSFIFVSKDKKFNILNYAGEEQLKDTIPTYVSGFRGRTTSQIPTFKIEVDKTVVTIYIMENAEDENAYSTYKFNTVNGEFTKVIS